MWLKQILDAYLSQLDAPPFEVSYWDEGTKKYGADGSSVFRLIIKDKKTARRLITEGSIGFGESFMQGKLEIEGDIEEYIKLRYSKVKLKSPLLNARKLLRFNASSPNNRSSQIAYHYDLGNDFFKLILDKETMSYSSGSYKKSGDSLSDAQKQKLSYISDQLKLSAGMHVLDLGCGWGGFAQYAVEKKQCDVLGYTLSKKQHAYGERVAAMSPHPKKFHLHYGDMMSDIAEDKFDAIAAIESIEHVGEMHLQEYFELLANRAKPGARIYIQSTARYVPRKVDSWTLKYVFPGGYLPTIAELIDHAGAAGLTIVQLIDDTNDYIRTITTWLENLEANEGKIVKRFSLETYRLWYLWMHGAKVAFELNQMSLFRLTLEQPK